LNPEELSTDAAGDSGEVSPDPHRSAGKAGEAVGDGKVEVPFPRGPVVLRYHKVPGIPNDGELEISVPDIVTNGPPDFPDGCMASQSRPLPTWVDVLVFVPARIVRPDGRENVVILTVPAQRDLDARTRDLPRFEKDELVAVRYDHSPGGSEVLYAEPEKWGVRRFAGRSF
jgi:hypothetical protein